MTATENKDAADYDEVENITNSRSDADADADAEFTFIQLLLMVMITKTFCCLFLVFSRTQENEKYLSKGINCR